MSVKVYGNQHGTFVRFEGKHATLIEYVCYFKGWTPERFLDEALNEYIQHHHPDYKGWVA